MPLIRLYLQAGESIEFFFAIAPPSFENPVVLREPAVLPMLCLPEPALIGPLVIYAVPFAHAIRITARNRHGIH